MRKMGEITSDLEELLGEMVDVHDLQTGEIMSLVHNWIEVHRPDAREEYEDGSSPIFYYGPID